LEQAAQGSGGVTIPAGVDVTGTWFSGGFDSVRFTFGLSGLKGLFQPK